MEAARLIQQKRNGSYGLYRVFQPENFAKFYKSSRKRVMTAAGRKMHFGQTSGLRTTGTGNSGRRLRI